MGQWFLSRGGQRFGPYDGATLKHMAGVGQLVQGDYLWREGMAEWVKAGTLQGVFPPPAPQDAFPILDVPTYLCWQCAYQYPQEQVYAQDGQYICHRCYEVHSEYLSRQEQEGVREQEEAEEESKTVGIVAFDWEWDRRDAGTVGAVLASIAIQPWWPLKVAYTVQSYMDEPVQVEGRVSLRDQNGDEVYDEAAGYFTLAAGRSRPERPDRERPSGDRDARENGSA